MKLEIDLDKVRQDVLFRQEAMANHGGITVNVRKWGEQLTMLESMPDEIAIDMMSQHIEMKIAELMAYAPDVSEIKPDEIRIERIFGNQKVVIGTFYYCSQIADHWEKQKQWAVERARDNERYNILFALAEEWGDCSCKGESCWHKMAANDVNSRLHTYEGDDE